MALLALEAVQTSGMLVTVASTAAGVTAVTLADMAPAHAGPITMSGSNATGSTFTGGVSTATYTIFDLVDGGTSTAKTATFAASNSAGATRTITGAAYSIVGSGSGTLRAQAVSKSFSSGAVSSTTANYTYRASSTSSVLSQTSVYSFPGPGNTSATLTVIGSGVAPVAGVSATNGFVLVNNATSGVQVTITNSGTGNKATTRVDKGVTLNNLNGSIGSISGFTGSGGSVNLGDAFGGPAASKTFTFTPTTLTKGQTFAGSAVATFSNGISATNAVGSLTATLSGTGVAPVNALASSATTLARVGGPSVTSTISISNVGDGNKSGAGSISNLNGTISNSLGTGFTAKGGNPSTLSLADSASTTLGFTFQPVSKGTSTVTSTFTLSNGSADGKNTAATVTASVSAQGVAPELQTKFNSVVNTATAVAGGATASSGPTISFGSVGYGVSTTVYLDLANITTDPNGGDNNLTNLTLNSFAFGGPDASKFSVGLANGTVISKGGSVWLPITVLSTTLGALASTLTIFTDQSVALGGVGDTFTYNLTALVPEPMSIALLGGGLAGLAAIRGRKHRRKVEAVA